MLRAETRLVRPWNVTGSPNWPSAWKWTHHTLWESGSAGLNEALVQGVQVSGLELEKTPSAARRRLSFSSPDSGLGASPEFNQMKLLTKCLEPRAIKGAPMDQVTVYVDVPSSEHVAEIVGKKGVNIKSLRERTNTFIKTPWREEPPVFVVTGQETDVQRASAEIRSESLRLSQARAVRRLHLGEVPIRALVTTYVEVPPMMVGLVVGAKGRVIKTIQEQSNTYIVTPARSRRPLFEVSGLPEAVELARSLILTQVFRVVGNIDVDAAAFLARAQEAPFLAHHRPALGR